MHVHEQQYGQPDQNNGGNRQYYEAICSEIELQLAQNPLVYSTLSPAERQNFIKMLRLISWFVRRFPNQTEQLSMQKFVKLKRHKQKVELSDRLAWYKISNKSDAYDVKSALKQLSIYIINRALGALRKSLSSYENMSRSIYKRCYDIGAIIDEANQYGIFDNGTPREVGRWTEWHREKSDNQSKVVKGTSKQNCKRDLINRLPENWEETVARRMGYDATLDLYIVAGLRPSEVERTELTLDGEQLVITVFGSKVTKNTGQVMRIIHPNMTIASATRLATQLKDFRKLDFHGVNLSALRQRIRRVGLDLFGISVSPYCFRHRIAGLIKAYDRDSGNERVGKLMGHASTASSSAYGNRSGKAGKGRHKLINPITWIETSQPIRHSKRKRYCTKSVKQVGPKNVPATASKRI